MDINAEKQKRAVIGQINAEKPQLTELALKILSLVCRSLRRASG
jgi:Holliday junction resolvasome RuvABC endonuclease subunit